MSESVPATIGKYQIIREIARSNDIVYEAYDPKMTRRVAVKELAMPRGASDQQREDRLKRFEREARAAGSLVHPNIVTIYDVGTDGDKNYIAMEFLTGRNLRKEIDKTGFIEPQKAVEIANEILEGLAFAHEHGVIHRDIKPDNVQLLDDGQIKLTDFGIARLTFEPNITMDGQVFGTPSYMSPEQINGQEIDARSDLFGVGVLLYEMVSGQKPFQGDSVVSITYAIMNKKPDQPQQANYSLWQVIERALEKTPDLRYRSAGEMLEALKQVQKQMASGSVVLDPVNTSPYVPPGQVVAGPPPVYNPYQAQPQAGTTPYGTPLPGSPGGYVLPPNQQPQYQPYQPSSAYTPYQAPAPTGQVPVYYPPPAKTPWFKPETKSAIGNFFLAVLLIGAVIGFVILVINALTNTMPANNAPAGDEAIAPFPEPVSTKNVPSRPSGANNASPAPELGAGNAPAEAPAYMDGRAGNPATQDPGNIEQLLRSADEAVDRAVAIDSPGLRQEHWATADSLFAQVIALAPNDYARAQYSIRASNKYISAANTLMEVGEREKAREAFRHAKGFANGDATMISEIDRAIAQLGG